MLGKSVENFVEGSPKLWYHVSCTLSPWLHGSSLLLKFDLAAGVRPVTGPHTLRNTAPSPAPRARRRARKVIPVCTLAHRRLPVIRARARSTVWHPVIKARAILILILRARARSTIRYQSSVIRVVWRRLHGARSSIWPPALLS